MGFSKICVFGLGYIGLPTAAVFASRKIEVLGVDINPDTVETINQGEIHIVEPDLDMVVHAAVTEGYLRASLYAAPADAFLIAVPTPFKGDNHEPDLDYIRAASQAIAKVLEPGNLVVLESTSPVGATEKVEQWLSEARPDLTFPFQSGEESDIRIAHCPERVMPGQVMRELVENDRVIGGLTITSAERARELYCTFVQGEIFTSDARTAEMAKLTENSFRDVNIAFANELSMICSDLGLNVWELIRVANRHPRVNILSPGPGVGGHCIAVDPWFIISRTPDLARIIRTARTVNLSKPEWVLEKALSLVGSYLNKHSNQSASNVTVACYGLTFKPDIDDLRESPALSIVHNLLAQFAGNLLVVEPNIKELPDSLQNATLTSEDKALKNANIHIVLVPHRQFRKLIGEFEVLDHCLYAAEMVELPS